MEYGTQVVSLAVVIAIFIGYFHAVRMPFTSTKLFARFLTLSLLSIVAEDVIIYLLSHTSKYNATAVLLRFADMAFGVFIVLMALTLFLYVDIKLRSQKHYTPQEFVMRLIPLAVAVAMIVGSSVCLSGAHGGTERLGLTEMAGYAGAVLYLLLAILRLIQGGQRFTHRAKRCISAGICIWMLTVALRFLYTNIRSASIGVALLLVFVYISYDDPCEYADPELKDVFNRRALEFLLSESFERRRTFYIVSLVLSPIEVSGRSANREEAVSAMNEAVARLGKRGLTVYSPRGNMLCVVSEQENVIDTMRAEKWGNMEFKTPKGFLGNAKSVLNILECPGFADSIESVMALLDHASAEGSNFLSGPVREMDATYKYQMNHYVAVEELIRDALEQDGFKIYYQPIYSVKDMRFVSAEALVRLRDTETLGFVSPEIFIPIAEDLGMLDDLCNMVLEKVCAFAKQNQLWRHGVQYLEVNISWRQSIDANFPTWFVEVMRRHGIPPAFINLEFAEAVYTDRDMEEALSKNMEALNKLGYQFSMDDFGVGYSKFSKLMEGRFRLIKLDKNLIWSCFESKEERSKVVLASCIDMLHRIGMQVVAEGVETAEQASFLAGHGVEYLQGYFFARPMSEKKYLSFVDGQGSRPVSFR